ncbi:Glycosyltransferase family 17 [Nocardioides alpinus]|uniref:Glycosyltransferase family 17 n=1 Tax=Nocardioides alpinus TaxID=748909 RepID=A0A1I0W4B0_9ACTN|nr:hypothetical protein [Nocardioides alpinus]SFA83167.1 Glycosyltransferase family 17 [Nocardioides alpinus]
MARARQVVDAFPINDELDLLRLRIDYLAPYVDRFVVAESPRTFTGAAKPLHVTDNLARFADIADRLTVVTYDAADDATAWEREELSRRVLRSELAAMPAETVALVGDVDEFPSRSQLERLPDVECVSVVPLHTFYRRANWRLEGDTPWLKVVASPVGLLPADLHALRNTPAGPHVGGAPGAHLSFMGFDAQQLATKLRAFSHTEFQFAVPAAQHVLSLSDDLALDHFGRADAVGRGVLTVLSEREEGEVHAWLRPRRPDWFGPRPRALLTWREMNAAVLHVAMESQDAALLTRLGTVTTLRHAAAHRALRLRARQLAGRVRHAGRR